MKRYWRIEGFDGTKRIYERRVETWHFSNRKINKLLRVLTAKAELSFDEIVGADCRLRQKHLA